MRTFLLSFWHEPRVPDPPRRVWRDWALVALLAPLCIVEVILRDDLPYRASRHTWPIDGGRWFVRFLLDHPKGAEPALPAALPDELCRVWPAP